MYDGITCIVFDYGGVISLPQDEGKVRKICSFLGVEPSVLRSIYSRMRHDFDLGLVNGEEYWKTVIEALGKTSEISEKAFGRIVRYDFLSWLKLNRKTLSLIRKLESRGYTLAVLSNMTGDTLEYLRKKAAWLKYFRHTVFSCEINQTKPEENIYRTLLEKLSVRPERVIFIDDTRANVEGAEKLGIHGILFTGAESLALTLKETFGIRL